MGKAIGRFFEKILVGASSGCWEWAGTKSYIGYGQFKFEGRLTSPHRFAYLAFKGEIPEGHEIDHLCRNRACCNPRHLEAVTPHENRLRRSEVVTHCKRGHEMPPSVRGKLRTCLACRQITLTAWQAKNREHLLAYGREYNRTKRGRYVTNQPLT